MVYIASLFLQEIRKEASLKNIFLGLETVKHEMPLN